MIDRNPFSCDRLKVALRTAGLTVLSDPGHGPSGLELAHHYCPDVVVLDLSVPNNIFEDIALLVQNDPPIAVVAIVTETNPEAGLLALRAGARGVRHRSEPVEHLATSVAQVLRGAVTLHDGLIGDLVERVRGLPQDGRGLRPVESPLTGREWAVLDLLTTGLTTAQIADELFLSPETVRSHLKHVMRKLGVHSRAEAAAAARRLRPFG